MDGLSALLGRAEADRGRHLNERGLVLKRKCLPNLEITFLVIPKSCLDGFGARDGGVERAEVGVAVLDVVRVPAVRLVALQHVLCTRPQ